MSDNDLMVIRAEASGYMNLSMADVTFGPGVNEVRGDNRQGKSCVLSMIHGLGGKKFLPEVPKNTEVRKGSFEVTLGRAPDEAVYVAKWSFTDKTAKLSLTRADGEEVDGTPQDVLTSLLSGMIDPWAFIDMATGSPAERRKAQALVQSMVTVDVDLGAEVKALGYDEEDQVKAALTEHSDNPFGFVTAFEGMVSGTLSEWRAKLRNVEGHVEELEEAIPIPERALKHQSITELLEEREALSALARQHATLKIRGERLEQDKSRLEQELANIAGQIEALREESAQLQPMEDEDLEAMDRKIAGIEQHNAMAAKAQALSEAEQVLASTQEMVSSLTADVDAIRALRKKIMTTASVPVPGLEFDGDKFLLDGKPLSQASREESLSAGFAIAMRSFDDDPGAQKLKCLVCKDANVMLGPARARLEALAKEHGIQIILELATTEKKPGVIFVEDGIAKNAPWDKE